MNEMKYFCKNEEREGSCYIEFIRGDLCSEVHWPDSSIYICDEMMGKIGLTDAVREVIPTCDPYGPPVFISREEWDSIKQNPKGKESQIAIDEISSWINSNFQACDFFVILCI